MAHIPSRHPTFKIGVEPDDLVTATGCEHPQLVARSPSADGQRAAVRDRNDTVIHMQRAAKRQIDERSAQPPQALRERSGRSTDHSHERVTARWYVSLGAPGLPDLRIASPLHSPPSKAHNVGISPAEGDHRVEQAVPGKAGVVPTARSPYLGKRLLDVVVGLALSIVTLPIILVLATISAGKFRCSPFFVQERVGLNGESFRCVKIRSLPAETPAYLTRPHSTITASLRVGAASCVGSISTSCRSSGTWSAAR